MTEKEVKVWSLFSKLAEGVSGDDRETLEKKFEQAQSMQTELDVITELPLEGEKILGLYKRGE